MTEERISFCVHRSESWHDGILSVKAIYRFTDAFMESLEVNRGLYRPWSPWPRVGVKTEAKFRLDHPERAS